MIIKKRKICSRFWKFVVIRGKKKKTIVALTKKRIGYKTNLKGSISKKKTVLYSLEWNIDGLRSIMKKTEMKGVITSSEYFPSDFTNYSQSKEKFSSKYIKKTINRALKNYIRRKKRYEEIRNIPKIRL